ncbi:MAG: hypothetical protein JRJ87_25070, partial [Deltaproteobacteria bacterium]|nr:hypothetical protein [Deltaproteobacteria bacterium]
MKSKSLWLLAASLVGLAILPLLACDAVYDPSKREVYTEVRGTIRIPAILAPLLASQAEEGDQMRAGEPGNCSDTAYPLPDIVADDPALVVKGEIIPIYAGGSCEPATIWFSWQVNKRSSLTVNIDWERPDEGFVPIFYEQKAGSAFLDFLMWDTSGGPPPESMTFVANPTSTYYLRFLKWYGYSDASGYTLTFSAVSGTVVGRVLVGAYVDPEPFKIVPAGYTNENDTTGEAAAGQPKHPVAGTTALDYMIDESSCDEDGNCDLVGWFDGLLIPVIECQASTDCIPPICRDLSMDPSDPICAVSPCVDGYCAYNVIAFADNDGGNTLNFATDGPPTTADFVTAQATQIPN